MIIIGTIASSIQTAPPSSLLTGLLGYWKFDESSSGALVDSTGNVNGTAVGTPTYGATGKINTSLTFASGSYVNMGTNANLRPASGFTTSNWFKTSSGGQGLVTNFRTVGNDYGFSLTIAGAGTLLGKAADGAGHTSYLACTTAVNTNTWFHVFHIYDFTGSTEYIYLNNVSDGTPYSFGYVVPYDTNNVFNIGARDSIYTFTGSIDEVGFWNRMLTSAERATIYNSGTGKAYPF